MPFTKPENEHQDLIAEQAMTWFSQLQSESVSAEKKLQFLHWQAKSPLHKSAYDEILLFWNDSDFNQALTETPLSSSYTAEKTASHARLYWLSSAMAAGFALFAIMFDPLIYLQADYQTAIGAQQQIQLSDGSSVTLNTDSALAIDFTSNERRVRLLKGEAFFAVYSNKNRPFIIDSGETETRVLGTKFIVNNNPNGDKVTVLEGLVKVSSLNHDESINIHPEQQVINSNIGLKDVTQVNLKTESAWLNKRLVYKDQSLEDVINDLDRYLPGTIVIKDSELNHYKINARLNISNPKSALLALQHTLPITITQLSPWLTIISKS